MNNYDEFEGMLTPDMVDISLEDFDSLDGEHEFSEEYKEVKKQMLKNYRKSKMTSKRAGIAKVAVAACAVIIGTPFIVNAATNGEFFARIWGNMGRGSIASHDEEVYEEEKNTTYTVTYPQVDYEEADPEKAQELIGENVSFEPVEYTFNDGTKLNILSTVSDGNSAVVEFTLEKEGGVDCLNYSQLDNEAKGAWFKEESSIYCQFEECSGKIFVDLDKSTDDKLYCYDYMTMDVWGHGLSGLTLFAQNYPVSRVEYYEMEESDPEKYKELTDQIKGDKISVPLKEEVAKVEYVCDGDGSVVISPLSMNIDMNKGLGLAGDEAGDPWSAYYVAVHYKDGTDYVVREHEYRDIHSCDVEIDNSAYGCGTLDNHMIYVFNRLVDVDEIDYIQVNEVKYSVK